MLRDYLIQIYSQSNIFFDLLFISSNIILTASLGFILSFALQKIHQDWVTTFHHRITFVLLPVITLTITTIISGNIALSLGMIGALSIVRFRNPVKNPFELVMYFALITLGITSSINFIYSTTFFVIIFYSFFKFEKYYREVKKKSLHKLSFSEGIKFNFIEVITTNEESILSKNEFIIDEFFDYQNSEYQYKFACPDRVKVQEVKLIIENLDKANVLSFNVRYN